MSVLMCSKFFTNIAGAAMGFYCFAHFMWIDVFTRRLFSIRFSSQLRVSVRMNFIDICVSKCNRLASQFALCDLIYAPLYNAGLIYVLCCCELILAQITYNVFYVGSMIRISHYVYFPFATFTSLLHDILIFGYSYFCFNIRVTSQI